MPRLSRWLLAAALTLPCLAAYGQEGDPSFICFPAEDAEANVASMQARGISVQVLAGDAALRFVAIVNAIEPVTDYKAEKVVVMMSEEVGAFAFVSGGVACAMRMPVPADVLKSWINTARGTQV